MQGGGELVKMWHLKEMGTNSALMVIIHVIQVQSIHNNCVLPLGETCTILMCECLGSGGGNLKWPLRMPPLGRHTCKVPHIVWGFWDTFLHYWALHQSSFYTLVSYGPYTDKKKKYETYKKLQGVIVSRNFPSGRWCRAQKSWMSLWLLIIIVSGDKMGFYILLGLSCNQLHVINIELIGEALDYIMIEEVTQCGINFS